MIQLADYSMDSLAERLMDLALEEAETTLPQGVVWDLSLRARLAVAVMLMSSNPLAAMDQALITELRDKLPDDWDLLETDDEGFVLLHDCDSEEDDEEGPC